MGWIAHHRLSERQKLKSLLLSRKNILMLAPRRIGKTWLMKQVDEDLDADGWTCIRIEVAGMDTEQKFLSALCERIDQKRGIAGTVKSYLTAKLQQIKVGKGGDSLAQMIAGVDLRQFSETLMEALNEGHQRTLLLIDEFPLFVLEYAKRDPDGVRTFLYHLRRLQQGFPNVSWFLTGSVGLDVVARRFKLEGALLDFEIFPLEPFTREEARSFLAEQSDLGRFDAPLEYTDEAFDRLVGELGWLSPYYLYHLARCTRPTHRLRADGPPIAEVADVVQAFDTLLQPAYRMYFAAWPEHIEKNFPPDETARLRSILEKCCGHADGEMESTLLGHLISTFAAVSPRELKDLLSSLAGDGLLMKDGDRWRFRSGLMRRYWLEYMA